MRKLTAFLCIVTFIVSCNNKNEMKNTPLTSIIKLHSSESLLNFEEAESYIDVDRVYGKNPNGDNPKEEWKKTVTFIYNLGSDKKFTSQFKYYKYNIHTKFLDSDKSRVIFSSLDDNAKLKKIIYDLELTNNQWKVVDIEYIN